ncbi:MAG: alpha/beta hydrolase family protein [Nitriliruptorales bacterium]
MPRPPPPGASPPESRLTASEQPGGRLPVFVEPGFPTRVQAARLLLRWLLNRPLPGDCATGWRDVLLRPPAGEDLPAAPGRLWLVPRPAPAVLLAAGVTPQGTADPRLVRLATAIARTGRVVFAPQLALARHELDEADIERLVTATRALHAHPRVRGSVAMLGFSFGASYALLAAADPRVGERLRLVASFGGYGDLGGIIQAATTGVTLLDGQRYEWRPDPPVTAREAVIDLIIQQGRLLGAETVEAVVAALRGEMETPSLPPSARSIHELVTNRDPAATSTLLSALPPPLSDLITRLSPVCVAGRVRAPVVLLHAENDPIIPYAELRRLVKAFPHAHGGVVRLFRHVDFRPSPRQIRQATRDLRVAWQFATTLLAAGE